MAKRTQKSAGRRATKSAATPEVPNVASADNTEPLTLEADPEPAPYTDSEFDMFTLDPTLRPELLPATNWISFLDFENMDVEMPVIPFPGLYAMLETLAELTAGLRVSVQIGPRVEQASLRAAIRNVHAALANVPVPYWLREQEADSAWYRQNVESIELALERYINRKRTMKP